MKQPHLIWLNPASLAGKLDAATWLQTTSGLRHLGWRVTLLVYGETSCHSIDGVAVHCIQIPQLYLLRQVAFHVQCLRLILDQWSDCDVILFYAMSAPWILPLLFLRRLVRFQRPLIAMDTRTLHMEPPGKESGKDKVRRWYHALMARLVIRWADGNLVITQRMAAALDIPEDKLWGVWPSGVDIDLFNGARESRCWPASGEPVRLIYIGSLNYERNLLGLSKAVAAASDKGMNVKLRLVGSGTEEADLKAFAATTAGGVEVKPPVAHEQVPHVLSEAHVGVLPFPDEEKFQVSSPIKLFEYMAAGLPILATRIACHTDVMNDADCVFWADGSSIDALFEALEVLWSKRGELERMGQQSAGTAYNWTWTASAQKLKAALEIGLARYPLKDQVGGR